MDCVFCVGVDEVIVVDVGWCDVWCWICVVIVVVDG